MKKGILVYGVICSILTCKVVNAADGDKHAVGIVSGIVINNTFNNFNASKSSAGFFFNIPVTGKSNLKLELKYQPLDNPSNSRFLDKILWKDWSASLTFNCYLKPVFKKLKPFIGLGVGQYFIQDSKSKIKTVKEHPEKKHLEYDMRDYFKRPGFFGTAGLEFKARSKTFFFVQTKCSVLFEQDKFIGQPSNFTDFINLTMGVRYILK